MTYSSEFLYNIGDIVCSRLILDRHNKSIETNKKKIKRYDCKCLGCGKESTITEYKMNIDCGKCNKNKYKKRRLEKIKEENKKFKFDVGFKIGNLEVVERKINEKEKKSYTLKCGCGNLFDNIESTLINIVRLKNKNNDNCVKCMNKLRGKQSIFEEEKWMIDYLCNKEDAKKYTKQSNIVIEMKCPICKEEKPCKPAKLFKNGNIGCKCSNTMSFGERVITSLLVANDIRFNFDKIKEWSFGRKYDFYLPDFNCIIETHGIQHYEETNRGRSLEEEIKNDVFKKDIAIKNGIVNYIELDCRVSEVNYIVENIKTNCFLNKLFEKKDESLIKEYFKYSTMFKVCSFYEENKPILIKEVGDKFEIDIHTVKRYLKNGTELGFCSYDINEQWKHSRKTMGQEKKPVIVKKNGIILNEFKSAKEACDLSEKLYGIKFSRSKVSLCCNGKRKNHQGFEFAFAS